MQCESINIASLRDSERHSRVHSAGSVAETKTCLVSSCDLHKLFHRKCGRVLVQFEWHAHLARDFTGGTPVPLLQTEPVLVEEKCSRLVNWCSQPAALRGFRRLIGGVGFPPAIRDAEVTVEHSPFGRAAQLAASTNLTRQDPFVV
jgi:hypothetical protein